MFNSYVSIANNAVPTACIYSRRLRKWGPPVARPWAFSVLCLGGFEIDGGETPRRRGGAIGVDTELPLGRGGRPRTGECMRTDGGTETVSLLIGTREVERLDDEDDGIVTSVRSDLRIEH